MVAEVETIEKVSALAEKYKYGFVTDIETESAPKGLSEDIVRFISAKKNEPEWLLSLNTSSKQRLCCYLGMVAAMDDGGYENTGVPR